MLTTRRVITPSSQELGVAPRDVNVGCLLRQPAESDIEALTSVYVAAFGETIEYFGYSRSR